MWVTAGAEEDTVRDESRRRALRRQSEGDTRGESARKYTGWGWSRIGKVEVLVECTHVVQMRTSMVGG